MFIPQSNSDVLDFIMAIGDLDAFIKITGYTRESIESLVEPLLGTGNSAEQIMLYSLVYQQLDPDANSQGMHLFTAASVTGLATFLEYLDPDEDLSDAADDNLGFNLFVRNQMAQNVYLRNVHEATMSKMDLYVMRYGKDQAFVQELAVRMVLATLITPYVSTAIAMGAAAATFGLDLVLGACKEVYSWIAGDNTPSAKGAEAVGTVMKLIL